MKKLLLIALLIVGCVFADTIVYEEERRTKDNKGEKILKKYNLDLKGEYLGTLDGNAYLRKKMEILSKLIVLM